MFSGYYHAFVETPHFHKIPVTNGMDCYQNVKTDSHFFSVCFTYG